jgi:peptide-methionine (S)-S-oxide reductase
MTSGRSIDQAIYYYSEEQREAAEHSRDAFQAERGGFGEITTEVARAGEFFYAEDYHQQYLAKNPLGYCGLSGTGVSCPVSALKR